MQARLSAPAGSSAFCTITVNNLGPSAAVNVVLTDNIVSSTPFTISSVVPSAGTCGSPPVGAVTSALISCSLGTILAQHSATVTITFSAANGGDVNDTASVSSGTPDPNSGNNSAAGHVGFVSSADLSISKTALPIPVTAGTNLTYTITVNNAGPSTASAVVVNDTIPSEVSVLQVTPSAGSCTAGIPGNPLRPLSCTVGSLTNGASVTITVLARVSPSVPSGTTINNNSTVSSGVSDPNNSNNSATAAVAVVTNADLAIVKTSDKLTYKPSSTVTYNIRVTNNGPSDALAVVVTDNLPTVMQAIYLSDTGGCVKNASNPTVLTCNLGNMPVGTTRTLTIYERINGSRGEVK